MQYVSDLEQYIPGLQQVRGECYLLARLGRTGKEEFSSNTDMIIRSFKKCRNISGCQWIGRLKSKYVVILMIAVIVLIPLQM